MTVPAASAAPNLDPKDPKGIYREIFDDDRWVKEEFQKHFGSGIEEFASRLAAAFVAYEELNKVVDAVQSEQAGLVGAFTFTALDDLCTSTKLLVSGKLMPSGNLFRQAVESVAMATLCCHSGPIIVSHVKNTPVTLTYWSRVMAGDKRTRGHRALEQLAMNQAAIGLSKDSVDRLKDAKEHYDKFSHAGIVGIASRSALEFGGPVYLGGHFDKGKLEAYKIEVSERVGLCSILPAFIQALATRLH